MWEYVLPLQASANAVARNPGAPHGTSDQRADCKICVGYPDNMLKNMNKFRGLIHSQRVLLALTQAGVSREGAYRLVQRNAMKVWQDGADFLEELLADKDVRRGPSEEEIRDKFDVTYHIKQVDMIFRRVFG